MVYFLSLGLYILTGILIGTLYSYVTSEYYIYTFGASIAFGLIYSFIKIAVASITASQTKEGVWYDMVVDVLTDQVAL